jgi:hypothetical protein
MAATGTANTTTYQAPEAMSSGGSASSPAAFTAPPASSLFLANGVRDDVGQHRIPLSGGMDVVGTIAL